jgi:HNH endonuclease
MGSRTCPSCGQSKNEEHFWSGARRCRKCVGRETGARRSERAKEQRARVRQDFGLKISVSERRFKVLQNKAQTTADSLVPKTTRDTLAALSTGASICGFVGTVAMAFIIGPSLKLEFLEGLILTGGFLVPAVAFLKLAEHLEGPRKGIIADVSVAFLRQSLAHVEREQLEYLRFYTTPEWRTARLAVIHRDGRVCKMCSLHILLKRDITVDHVRPRSKFPQLALDLGNLQVLCRSCNSSKGATV